MRVAAVMGDLHHDRSAARVDGVGDRAPAGGLLVRVDARRVGKALRLRAHRDAFGDDHARRSALGVIFGVERGRRMAGAGPHSGHRRHHDAVAQLESAELQRLEKDFDGHGILFPLTCASSA